MIILCRDGARIDKRKVRGVLGNFQKEEEKKKERMLGKTKRPKKKRLVRQIKKGKKREVLKG